MGSGAEGHLGGVGGALREGEAGGKVAEVEVFDVEDVLQRGWVRGVGPDEGLVSWWVGGLLVVSGCWW